MPHPSKIGCLLAHVGTVSRLLSDAGHHIDFSGVRTPVVELLSGKCYMLVATVDFELSDDELASSQDAIEEDSGFEVISLP